MIFRDQLGRSFRNGDRVVFYSPRTHKVHSCLVSIGEDYMLGLTEDPGTGELRFSGHYWEYDGKLCYAAFIVPRFFRKIRAAVFGRSRVN